MKNSLIVYFSLTGRTEKVGKIISEFLKNKGVNISLFKLIPEHNYSFFKNCQLAFKEKEIPLKKIPEINNYDFLFIGSPVWAFNITPAIRTFLNKSNLSGKNVFLFTTYGSGIGKEKAMRKMEEIVKEKNGKIKGRVEVKGKNVDKEKDKIEKEVEKCLKE